MKNEKWTLIQELFYQAIELNENQWLDFLKSLDHPDSIKQDVLKLLNADHTNQRKSQDIRKGIASISEEISFPKIAGYNIISLIAHGGMGSVYLALDTQLSRQVAIKVLHPHLSSQYKFKDRFMREARAAARIQHDNINTVFEIAESASGQIHITSAYCHGSNLAVKIRQNELNLDNILSIMQQLISALSEAHKQGVIHRDLKPENIIIDKNINLKLVDFGIAKIRDEHQTSSGDIIGTPAYMSPEQFRGEAIDPLTDIWAMGMILYEMLEGKTPFDGKPTPEIMYSMLHEPIQYSITNLETYRPLYDIIQQCLNINKSLRPASADVLLEAISKAKTRLNESQTLQITPEYEEGITSPNQLSHLSIATQKNVLMLHLLWPQSSISRKVIESASLIARKHRGQLMLPDPKNSEQKHLLSASFGYPQADEMSIKNGLRCGLSWLEQFANNQPKILASFHKITDSSSVTQRTTLSMSSENIELCRAFTNSDEVGFWITESLQQVLPEELAQTSQKQTLETGQICYKLEQLTQNSQYLFTAQLSPLTGRSAQLAVLQESWYQAQEGDQQRILLSGEAGIGKTRLIHEFKNGIVNDGKSVSIELACSPYEQATTYFPLTSFLKTQIKTSGVLTEQVVHLYLQSLLKPEPQDSLLLCKLLSVPIADKASATLPSGDLLNRKYQSLLTRILTSKPAGCTLLVIIEDLHWIDQATSLIVERLLRPSSTSSALILLSSRPEYKPTWLSNLITTNLYLSKLRLSQSEALLAQLMSHKDQTERLAIDKSILSNLAERTGGNPLFIEELAKSVNKKGYTEKSINITIPDSIQSILIARIEKLGTARELAQIASVIGRHFDLNLLKKCSSVSSPEFRQQFNTLIQTGLIYSSREENIWYFKHALIRDAAYQVILPDSRKYLHAHIATTLEDFLSDVTGAKPELLAQHWESAENWDKAVLYWSEAGQRNLQISAISECIDICHHALQLADKITDGELKDKLSLTLYATLGPALMNRHGYADERVNEAYSKALTLCDISDNTEQIIPVLFGLWTYHCVRSNHKTAHKLSHRMITISDPASHSEHICESHMLQGINDYYRGEFSSAQNHFNTAYNHYETESAQLHILKYGQNPAVIINNYRAWNELILGNFPESMAYCLESIRYARELNHPFTLVYALSFATWTHLNLQQVEQAQLLITESINICRDQEIMVFLGLSLALQALIYFATEEVELGMKTMQEANDIYLPTGATLFIPSFMTTQAEVTLKNGQQKEADELLIEAIAMMENNQELWSLTPALALKVMIADLNQDSTQLEHTMGELLATLDKQKAQGIKLMLQQKGLELPN